jgi:two-component system chemotaxis sensor kinase CheA
MRRPPATLVAARESGVFPVPRREAIMSVLVVDPNPSSRGAVAAALSARYRVYEATDGLSAIAVAKRTNPGLIITELTLPDLLDGLGVITILRAQSASLASIPFVVLTSRTAPQDMARAIAAGARRYLVKPCLPESLADVARRILDR